MSYLSREGLEKLKQRLWELKTKKRQEVATRLEHAKTLGDLSENAEYQEAKEEQSMIEVQISELEEKVRTAVVIAETHRVDEVSVGCTITVESDKGLQSFTIVGSDEADPVMGKISDESPIGTAFLGKKVGATVEVKTPGGVRAYKILEIR